MEISMQSGYRYSGKKYNDSLLALGGVRVGTLHDFRKNEHKSGISDRNEGRKTVSHHIDYARDRVQHAEHFEALKHFNAISFDESVDIQISDFSMIQEHDHPDCFVHCISSEYSQQVLEQFEGADSCVEIFDVLGFYKRLTSTLNMHVSARLLTIEEVVYKPRHEVWNGKNWGIHPALIKESDFARQHEIRAIWINNSGKPISPVLLNDVGLIPFCRSIQTPR
ncbi:hypothetical protein [Pseudomonas syringae]|uniref:hypothetical protein n=1 Tax=Pseudomonas syringae TaxID=317 RepID=UPI00126892E9|nr:hypothetical protein [Pseudomonas syringae]